MIEIKGKINTAVVYANELEENASAQLKELCDQEFVRNCRIRIMPDVHAGAGCVIGFTADLGELVIPNIVGVDIGCGMLTVELGKNDIDFARLDEIIRSKVPSGPNVHEGRIVRFPELLTLHCYRMLKDSRRIERSIGSLGGGNHFIEVDADDEGNKYLVIHSGSRNLGKQVAEYYQNLAYDIHCGKDELLAEEKRIIAQYKAEGRRGEIQPVLKELKKAFKAREAAIPKDLCYLTGEYRQMYLDDMAICQRFARLNRQTMADLILSALTGKTLADYTHFETVHNYIDLENNLVRKGAISASEGELMLIPMNMRDGSLICRGKGNSEWNCSAPHGAGRLFSRAEAKERFSVEEFAGTMEGIFTTSVGEATLDECPMAYKSMETIVENIAPTADILRVIRPLYNFKAN